jgi:adenosylcobinamide-GDP ribazoletransferase
MTLAGLLPLAFVALGWAEPRLWIALGLAHLAALGVVMLARARLGGITGDVLGLTVELSELAVLLAFAAHWP